jgi:uncharacterized membrane protein
MDLLIIIVLSLLLVPLALLTAGLLRSILGLLFVIFFPGYALIATLFPKKGNLDNIERLALSFALSIAVVPLLGLILNYTPWGIRLESIVVSVLCFILIMSGLALYRRRSLPPEERFEPNFRSSFSRLALSMKGQRLGEGVLAVLLVIAICGAIGGIVYAVNSPKVGEKFTEFYILDAEGNAANYPKEIALGNEGKVIVGIVNHEQETMTYGVEIDIDGNKVSDTGSIPLDNEAKWEHEVSFAPTRTGANQKIEFLLYKGQGSEPYQRLYLWVDVNGASQTASSNIKGESFSEIKEWEEDI